MRFFCPFLAALLTVTTAAAVSKQHTVTLGKAMPVKLFVGSSEDKTIDITVRP